MKVDKFSFVYQSSLLTTNKSCPLSRTYGLAKINTNNLIIPSCNNANKNLFHKVLSCVVWQGIIRVYTLKKLQVKCKRIPITFKLSLVPRYEITFSISNIGQKQLYYYK